MASVTSSAPPVPFAHLAAATSSIRVGSGGVMLPNHAPLVVAEQFATLEALHPGRVDLGLGRAPGTDHLTTRALRRAAALTHDTLIDDVIELLGDSRASRCAHPTPYPVLAARPGFGCWAPPPSTPASRRRSGSPLRLSLCAPTPRRSPPGPASGLRSLTRPAPTPGDGRRLGGVREETDDDARFLSGPSELQALQRVVGRPGPLDRPETAAAYA